MNFWVWQKLRANRWANQLCFKHHHRLSNMVCANIICSCLWSCFSTWLKTSKHFVKQKNTPTHFKHGLRKHMFEVWCLMVCGLQKSWPQTEFAQTMFDCLWWCWYIILHYLRYVWQTKFVLVYGYVCRIVQTCSMFKVW